MQHSLTLNIITKFFPANRYEQQSIVQELTSLVTMGKRFSLCEVIHSPAIKMAILLPGDGTNVLLHSFGFSLPE